MESFGDEVGQVGYGGPMTFLGGFGKEGKKYSILLARVWAEGL